MKGRDVISELAKKFKIRTDLELSKKLGITTQAIQIWKNREKVTERQLAGLISKAMQAEAANLQRNAIRPIAEFFRVDKCETKLGKKYELFDTKTKEGDSHPYLNGLRQELERCHGVYIFFDSRGRAIYTGKARHQELWKEMNNAFNRDRGEVQKVKKVNHPSRKQAYLTSDEVHRQIRDCQVPLHDLACYFSAYEIADGMVGNMEAMLVRSFANDLLNCRMERFGRHKRGKKLT